MLRLTFSETGLLLLARAFYKMAKQPSVNTAGFEYVQRNL